MNNLGCGPRGIGGKAFPLHVAGKVLIRGLQKDGINMLRTEVVISTVEFRKDYVDVSAGVKV